MVYCNKKQDRYLAKKHSFLSGIVYIPCSIVVVFCICTMIALPLSDNVVNGHMWLLALRYTLYALPAVLVLVALYIFNASGYVIFEPEHIKYYRYWFSKKYKLIPLDEVNECIAGGGIRKIHGKMTGVYGINLYNRGNALCRFGLSPRLLLKLYNVFGDKRFRLTRQCDYLSTCDKFFRIDFSELTEAQQLALFKRYCKLNDGQEIDGEKFLKKKGLL